jgi:hypothetical protein
MIHQAKSNRPLLEEQTFQTTCIRDFCFRQILLQKSKIEQPKKYRGI